MGFLVTKFHLWGNEKNFEYYGKIREKIPTSISKDFEGIVNNEINRLEEEGRIKNPYHKFVLQTESMALVLWFLRWNTAFFSQVQDEIFYMAHNEYFLQLKLAGLNENQIKEMQVEFEKTYSIYDKLVGNGDFTKIGVRFAQSVSEATKIDLDVTEVTIPIDLIEQTKAKLEEYRKVIKS